MQIRKVLRNYLATGLMDVPFLEMNLIFCFSCQKGVQCGPLCLWVTEDAWCTSYMARNPNPVQSGGSLKPHWGPLLIGGSWEGLPSGRIQLTLLSTDSTSNQRAKIFGKKNPERFIKQNLNLPHSSNYSRVTYIVFTIIYIVFTLY